MKNMERRKFLQTMGAAAAAGALPGSITKALAMPANNRTGTIADVEHIIIITQENQSFDRYFGTLRGVRGFSDPRAVKLPNGRPVWYQPNNPDSSGLGMPEIPPFRINLPSLGLTYLDGTGHGWNSGHAAWNSGNYDRWIPEKGPLTMSYLKRDDIPYHFALADAFTVCDAYHCSVMGPTDPNRYHMWTGWVGNDGKGGGPVLSNAEAGYDWTTFPERMQKAGVSWKVYQDIGVGLNDAGYWGWTSNAWIGNYGDNSLLYFHQYQNALPGTPLADRAKTGTNIVAGGTLFDVFREDVRTGKLPQVSYIASPEAYSEHSNQPANYGAWYISQFLDILTSNPDLWSKTIVFINYDENDGGFDHIVAPTPPQTRANGLSTVDTINEIFPGDASFVSGPIGLGVRVPLIAISPWSKGGYVNSQVFDHTSMIRFIEQRFAAEHPGLFEPNITPWRRAVAGDLTSIFNFATPNDHKVRLPSTAAYMPPDVITDPAANTGHASYPVTLSNVLPGVPAQEPGVRPARALPYELHVLGMANFTDKTFHLQFANTGSAAAVFHVRSGHVAELPRSYTVEEDKSLADNWSVGTSTYDLSVYGPNGFLRSFKGSVDGRTVRSRLHVRPAYDTEGQGGISLNIVNSGEHTAAVTVLDAYTGEEVKQLLAPREDMGHEWSLSAFHGWYDLIIRVDGDDAFEYRLAGHVETGRDSMTDPVLGGYVLKT
jgi:phospholipase C